MTHLRKVMPEELERRNNSGSTLSAADPFGTFAEAVAYWQSLSADNVTRMVQLGVSVGNVWGCPRPDEID